MSTSLILDLEIRKMRERMLLTLVTLLLTILLGECRIEGCTKSHQDLIKITLIILRTASSNTICDVTVCILKHVPRYNC